MQVIKEPVTSKSANTYLVSVWTDRFNHYHCTIYKQLLHPVKTWYGKTRYYEKKHCFDISCSKENFFNRYSDFYEFVETCIDMYEEELRWESKLLCAEEKFMLGKRELDFRI